MSIQPTRGIEAICARLEHKRKEYESYRQYLQMRVAEEDLHGIWDCGCNMSEVANYIDALEFAIHALDIGP